MESFLNSDVEIVAGRVYVQRVHIGTFINDDLVLTPAGEVMNQAVKAEKAMDQAIKAEKAAEQEAKASTRGRRRKDATAGGDEPDEHAE